MQIVIDIPEETYEYLKDYDTGITVVDNAVINGIPLPKGHGRLIDEKILKQYIIKDDCEEGCGYIDERDLIDILEVLGADTEGGEE